MISSPGPFAHYHDLFSRFIEDCLEVNQKGSEVAAQDLYDAYRSWCSVVGDNNPITQAIFGSRLQERDIQKKRKNTGNVYLDVSLKSNMDTEIDF